MSFLRKEYSVYYCDICEKEELSDNSFSYPDGWMKVKDTDYCPTCKLSDKSPYIIGYNAALKEAANICERLVVGGRFWAEEQKIAADCLYAASENIKGLEKK